jgi:hypothetical protein
MWIHDEAKIPMTPDQRREEPSHYQFRDVLMEIRRPAN